MSFSGEGDFLIFSLFAISLQSIKSKRLDGSIVSQESVDHRG